MLTAKAARVNLGYTQGYCAKELGMSRSTYIKYENGETAPSVNTAKRIAEFLCADFNELVFLPKVSLKD